MTHAVTIPKLGLTMEEAVVIEWGRADREIVKKGDVLITIETDKIMFDVEAEQDGYLQRVAQIGATLPVGGLAAWLHPSADFVAVGAGGAPAAAAVAEPATEPATATATAPVVAIADSTPSAPAPAAAVAAAPSPGASASAAQQPAAHPASLHAGSGASGQRLMASPVARQLAKAQNLDLAAVPGSGPGGVILKRDVLAAERANTHRPVAAVATVAPIRVATPAGGSSRTPMSSMRKAIAQRMMQSLTSKAQMTGFGRIDMAEAVKLREALVAAEKELGARITFTDLVIKAAATVLAGMPEINAYIDGNDIVTWSEVNIGLAVAVDGGLMVPVIRNADRLNLVETSLARQALIAKSRAGKLTREDVEGGTFTVSNFGSYGGDFETPILNAPQSALLGIGQITDEAVVRDKQIVIRPMMSISMTFDHCLIDGSVAGLFRSRFKAMLEQPAQFLARLR